MTHSTSAEVRKSLDDLFNYLDALITRKEREPQDDIVSRLVAEQLKPGHVDRLTLINMTCRSAEHCPGQQSSARQPPEGCLGCRRGQRSRRAGGQFLQHLPRFGCGLHLQNGEQHAEQGTDYQGPQGSFRQGVDAPRENLGEPGPLAGDRGTESLLADAVFGWRQIKKKKVTSAAAILSLALAIGACTAAFRLIDGWGHDLAEGAHPLLVDAIAGHVQAHTAGSTRAA